MISFEEARALVAASQVVRDVCGPGNHFEVRDFGWQNDDVYQVAIRPERDVFDGPSILVDKRTGEVRTVYGTLGRPPVPGLMLIGALPGDADE